MPIFTYSNLKNKRINVLIDLVKCITFDDGGKGDFGTNKSKIPGLRNHYSVTLIYFFQNFQFIGRYTVMILLPKSRKYRISEYHYIVNFIFFFSKNHKLSFDIL